VTALPQFKVGGVGCCCSPNAVNLVLTESSPALKSFCPIDFLPCGFGITQFLGKGDSLGFQAGQRNKNKNQNVKLILKTRSMTWHPLHVHGVCGAKLGI
jgi:hypothetical protein